MAEKRIPKFSSSKNPSKKQLAEFRNYVSQLKRKGILTGKINPKIVRPGFVRGGRKLADIVNRHRDKLKPFTPKSTPPAPAPSKLPSDKLTPLNRPVSIRNFPVKGRTLAKVLKDLEENADELDKLKKPGERFAFQIDGIRSYGIFPSMERLANYLGESAGIQHILRKREGRAIYESLKIVRWNKTATEWKPEAQKLKRKVSRADKQAKNRRK